MVCQICQIRIFATAVTTGEDRPHHITYTSFKRSVDEGCFICNRLWNEVRLEGRQRILKLCEQERDDHILDHQAAQLHETPVLDDTVPLKNCPTLSALYVQAHGSGHTDYGLIIRLRAQTYSRVILSYSEDIEVFLQASSKLGPNTRSVETFSLAKKWISQCVETHDSCQRGATKSWYPTRLIECGSTTGSDCCRLVQSGVNAITGHYMTLSHCWGQTKCLKLTTENYAELMNEIPMTSLPQLYQDAVYVARQLDVKYLWIDSLCIIQEGDDLKDWQHEVTLMSEVYYNSFCNISAAAAPDSEHSMFNFRHTSTIFADSVDIAVGGQDASSYLMIDEWSWDREVTRAYINTRAWVLQERLLSARTLHFGETRLSWECNHKDASDIFPAGLPRLMEVGRPSLKAAFASVEKKDFEIRLDYYELCKAWKDIVFAYTCCNLTFPSDKLVAISSIAKRMRSIMQDQYLAGLWRRELNQHLLWFVVKGRLKGVPPVIYRAPTWSWAATEGVIHMATIEERPDMHIKVEDFEVQYVTDDDTGQVKGGWLRLRGHLRSLELEGKTGGGPLHHNRGYVYLDSVPNNGRFVFHRDSIDHYYMPARFTQRDQGEDTEILLLEVVDREKGIFRRDGLWRGALGQNSDTWKLLLAFQEGEENYPCEEYRDGHHYIRII